MQAAKIEEIIKSTIFFRVLSSSYYTFKAAMETVGHIGFNLKDTFLLLLAGKIDFKKVIKEASRTGVDSLPLVLMISWLAGMIISLELATEMVKQGGGHFVGAFVTLVMLKELGPIMAAFAIVFMEGSSMSAEIASMKVTEQVDAMKTLNVNPIQYLIAPKVVAGILIVPAAVVVASLTGILGGLFTSTANTELTVMGYLESVRIGLFLKDICASLVKGAVFGGIIAVVSATIGYETEGGALDVGKSTTKAVVWSITIAAIFDYIISALFI
ncbi:MAG: ABC transporter permease [Candidatus Gastranaerophilales bacterium]|nr:ABC transporter permease [Candidatus Gastranaerophilales bacterium]